MGAGEFPVISIADIETDFELVSKRLFDAAQQWGFFVVTDHGVTSTSAVQKLSHEFLELPVDVKSDMTMDKHHIGYDGRSNSSFAAAEAIMLGGTTGALLTSQSLSQWWTADKRQIMETFKTESHNLCMTLMSALAVHLGLDKDFFTRIHDPSREPGDAIRSARYPKLDSQPPAGTVPRLSAHTDWGSMTLVFTEQAGLEVQDPRGNWYMVPIIPGAAVVNIGDALSMWTGKALKSTLHRITWENLPHDQDRHSIAFFCDANSDVDISPINAPAGAEKVSIKFGDYYKVRQKLTYSDFTDKSGQKVIPDLDPAVIDAVYKLGVADAGKLKANTLIVA